jgi:O-antigen/teichoic acid export membrane protein
MATTSENNKRIAKNTLFLYARLLLMMAISLFTSRVILDSLGEDNYGIYNVVGGVVAMFAYIQNSLIIAIQRFLTFELGAGNKRKLQKVFTTSVNIQIILAVIVFVLAETIGLWFLNTKMSIPEGRMAAANFVLQCSIITTMISIITVPYNAIIIAHEHMDVFAFFSIIEVTLKLAIAYLLYISWFDQLKLYAGLLLVISILMRLIYSFYCRWKFEEAHFSFGFDRKLFKEMASFAGWSFIGNTSSMLNTHGVNMLINVFFGVKVNAARAIAIQVETAIHQFVNGFTTAINPQITKSYASNDYDYLYLLICRGSKFSFFIMLLMAVPVIVESDTILSLWLIEVPAYTSIFLKLVILYSLIASLANSMVTGILATGNIKRYQIEMNVVSILIFPLSWIAYYLGAPAYMTYVIAIIIIIFLTYVRLKELRRLIDFPVYLYLSHYATVILIVCVLAFLVPWAIRHFLSPSIMRFLIICIFSVLWTSMCIYVIGLEKNEREFLVRKVKSVICKFLTTK